MAGLRVAPRSPRLRTTLAAIAATTLLSAVGIMAATSANASAGCRVNYDVPNQWPGGFVANVTVTNLGDAINGWRLTWSFPSGQKINQIWSASATAVGANVTVTNVDYNASIPTNGSVLFGFLGSFSGSNDKPTSFALNGVTCTGTIATTSPSPSVLPTSSPPPSSPAPPGDAMATVAAMQPGWNLGNTLDAIPDETAWGNPLATKALFDTIKGAGYKSVRIPVTWSNHQGPAPTYTIDAAYLSRVRQVVDWALADDLYVLLNVHHDSWQWISSMPTDHDGVLNRFTKTWTQVATTFADEPAKLTLESVNEPQFTNTTDAQADQLIDELNRAFHRVVRATGGRNATRLLVLPNAKGVEPLATTITALKDPNLAATIHYYSWWPFSVNIAGKSTFEDPASDMDAKRDAAKWFSDMDTTFVAKGIPFIVGEYGLLSYDYTRPGVLENGEVRKYFEEVGYQARTHKMTTMLWDAGSFLNRNTLQWRDPELANLMISSTTTRSGTASSDQVFLPRSGAIAGQTLSLNLNGTTFTGLRQGTTDLVRGTDYTVSGNQLTLTGTLLTRLAGTRAYGVNATLYAQFSQGVPWRVDVITADPPVLSNATGTDGTLAIPTNFRGDRLKNLEAKYADGSAAGPANWTTYQEIGVCCALDHPNNKITLTADFIKSLKDGSPVTLTFHFWSGNNVTYRVTKSGSSVTGTAS